MRIDESQLTRWWRGGVDRDPRPGRRGSSRGGNRGGARAPPRDGDRARCERRALPGRGTSRGDAAFWGPHQRPPPLPLVEANRSPAVAEATGGRDVQSTNERRQIRGTQSDQESGLFGRRDRDAGAGRRRQCRNLQRRRWGAPGAFSVSRAGKTRSTLGERSDPWNEPRGFLGAGLLRRRRALRRVRRSLGGSESSVHGDRQRCRAGEAHWEPGLSRPLRIFSGCGRSSAEPSTRRRMSRERLRSPC